MHKPAQPPPECGWGLGVGGARTPVTAVSSSKTVQRTGEDSPQASKNELSCQEQPAAPGAKYHPIQQSARKQDLNLPAARHCTLPTT